MGKRHRALQAQVKKDRTYSIAEGIDLLMSMSNAKFDESVEIHFRLGIDPKKTEQQVRGTATLPHGTGKTTRVVCFVPENKIKDAQAAGADIAGAEELIEDIKKSQKTDFDVAVAVPEMMPKLAPIAKTLGTRGLMPNPKNDTVTPDFAKAIEELKKGKVAFKNDDTANIHLGVGKISFGKDKLGENITTIIEAISKSKPAKAKGTFIKKVTLSSTMGPGVIINHLV